MYHLQSAQWIQPPPHMPGTAAPVYRREFSLRGRVREAFLTVSARGVYIAHLNGCRASDCVLPPGWTAYPKRLQYQTYPVTAILREGENVLDITVGSGWYASRISRDGYLVNRRALIAVLFVTYADGTTEYLSTDTTWKTAPSAVLNNDLYDGETFDASYHPEKWFFAEAAEDDNSTLIAQEGEWIREQETCAPIAVLTTSKGETVLDFGQNLTGYVRLRLSAHKGDVVELSHGEILDAKGNFYNDNLRSAKAKIRYICQEGDNCWQPWVTFYGFRYIRIDAWPGTVDPSSFTAVVVHSDLRRTGYFSSSSPLLNSLYLNALWSQKDNYLDIPTDCPQRDERAGWLGDAQIFVAAAAYNYDIGRFFRKWLRDMAVSQTPSGAIPDIIPYPWTWPDDKNSSAAWGDAAVICPWQLYLAYGDSQDLAEHLPMMERWINYIRSQGSREGLWDTGTHYGDWLGLDAGEGSYKGKTDPYLIATAYYYYSTSLLIRAGTALGRDMGDYTALLTTIEAAFTDRFVKAGSLTSDTQTAYAVCLHFGLYCGLRAVFARRLAELVEENGCHLTTGFVGTPYILHALANNGYARLAVSLLLQKEYPSWLYPVKHGATTIWEHWDGLKPDGSLWSADMNSFNHYAYGAIVDFLYGVLCGISPEESAPGYRQVRICPLPDERLDWAEATLDTRYGRIVSGWKQQGSQFCHTVIIPAGCIAFVTLNGTTRTVEAGIHHFISAAQQQK